MTEGMLGTAYVLIRAKLDQLDQDLAGARGKIQGALSGSMAQVGAKMAGVGAGITAGVTLPILAAGTAALELGGQLDDALDTIRTGTGATGATLTALGEDVKAVFGAIPTDMATAGQAIADLNARTGQTGQGLQELAQAEIELARITGGELGSQIQNTTRMFGDWGITVANQVPALDALLRAHQATGIEVDNLAAKLVQFGAPLRQMGFDFATSAALIGKFEKEGVNTELVLGSLRIALGKLAKAGIEPKEGLKQLVAEIQATGSTAEANMLAIAAFGARAGPDMAAAIREGRFDVEALYKTIAGGSETVKSAAADTADFAEKFTVLKNKVLLAALPLGTTLFEALNNLLPTIEKIVGFVAKLIKKFTELPPGVRTGILAFLGIAAAVGPVITAIGGIISAVGVIGPAFAAIGTVVIPAVAAIVAAIGPILLIIAAVIAVIAVLYLAWKNNFLGIRDAIMPVIEAIKLTIWSLGYAVQDVMAFLRGEMDLEALLLNLKGTWNAIQSYWASAWEKFAAILGPVWDKITGDVRQRVAGLTALISDGMDKTRNATTNAWDKIKETIRLQMAGIKQIVSAGIININLTFDALWESRTKLSRLFDLATGSIANFARGGQDLKATWIDVQGALIGCVRIILETFETMIPGIGGVKDGVLATMNAIADGITTIVFGHKAAAEGGGRAFGQALANGIAAGAGDAAAAALALVQKLRDVLPVAKSGPLSDLLASGRALADEIAAGIRASAPAVVAEGAAMAQKVRDVLPVAKSGPLSDLTAAGRELAERFGAGIRANQDAAVSAAKTLIAGVAGALEPVAVAPVAVAPAIQVAAAGPDMAASFAATWAEIKTTATTAWQDIATRITTPLAEIGPRLAVYSKAIGAYLTAGGVIWAAGWQANLNVFLAIFGPVWAEIRKTATTAWTGISTQLSLIWTALKTTATTTWTEISTTATTAWTTILTTATLVWTAISTQLTLIWTAISTTATTIWTAISTTATTIWTGISTGITNAVTPLEPALAETLNRVKTSITGIWEDIKGAVLDTVHNLIAEVRSAFANFRIDIPLPHFTVSWEDIGFGVSIPSIDVQWYRQGGDFIANGAMLIGVGEAGPERVQITPGTGEAAPGMAYAAALQFARMMEEAVSGSVGEWASEQDRRPTGTTQNQSIQVNVTNPVGETAEASVVRQLQRLTALGMLAPVG